MTLKEMESAVTNLSRKELDEFMAWLEEYYANAWDKQIEDDVNSGRLDQLLADVDREYNAGLSCPAFGGSGGREINLRLST